MLRYLPHQQIDPIAWDACLQASGERMLYGFAWYLDAVCGRWDAVVEEREGRYVSVFPLPLSRRFGQRVVQQPYFTQQLGLFTTPESSIRAVADYLALIPERYKQVYLQLNTGNVAAAGNGFGLQERHTYHLCLQPPYQQLHQAYSTNHKRNLKKARKANLQVLALDGIDVLIQLFKNTKGRELREMKPKHYTLLERLYSALRRHGVAELRQVVGPDGEVRAAALLVQQPDKVIFLFGASSEAGKRSGAMAFLLDSCIRRYAGTARTLDFEGSMVPSVAKFYAGFGGTPQPYVSLARHYTPWYLSWKKVSFTS
ncbi:GNAT family N-acetyltransferase [Pontibacter sp. E15-1]|uniref:GNAT family N-acetyltransferase n=1 Tax=Pontibacter sp. E15-1 TaxID=2919918 RepID=UPI001F4F80C7|nr:GNAT family N-acetyltransferase [Pontibacter sp. E15-1]MCJ8164826.1 GNAT family N-acetyltransferase [Pontibacter sp. E15-1]